MRPGARRLIITGVKTIHTFIWVTVECAMGYLIVAGMGKSRGRYVEVASTVVGTEGVIFVASGFRCPLTRLVDEVDGSPGGVTDIYLPEAVARSLPALHVPLVALALLLHRDRIARGIRAAR